MYKLLLVTDSPSVLEAHEAFRSWEDFGFRPPLTAHSSAEAMEILSSRRMDALSYALTPEETNQLQSRMIEAFPLIPVIDAGNTSDTVYSHMRELETLLNTLNGDFSDYGFNRHDMMQYLRHNFFRQVLGGEIKDEETIRRQLKLLRSRMDPDRSCVVVDMAMDDAEEFLTHRWHYGNERLETALRNFFGAELDGMRILISVLADGRIRMLCCPMLFAEVQAESLTVEVHDHISANIDHVREYLGMDLRVTGMTVLGSLTELACEV